MTHFPLRRAERAMSRDEALAVLDAAEFVTVSTVDDDGMPYGVPLSFVRMGEALYFHATNEGGHKTVDFRRDNRVCATAVTGVKAFFEDDDFTTSFRSVMAFGRIREVSDVGEFKHALVNLCMKYVPEAKHGIGKAMELEGPHTAVWAIDIDELSGKARSGPRHADAGADAAGACAIAGARETA
ncbi:pyridoxamine 5'-phosphate oxidase family protein [Eggerthella timonensis]|uniref:pyridoxamine 5'-phosphate oxidase family protein n=1 Tax=Eggerthella timonensis TaxID=1871008 RepID=UPI000C7758E9|nr:pyridoxamine 5'-phosphate oxidase family protein [Eggerthella timonensis]